MAGEENGNGTKAVTLAILGERLDQLGKQLEEHDRRQREEFGACRRNCSTDHDTIIKHTGELETLQKDVAKAKDTVDGLKTESRIITSLAGVVAIIAAGLGISKGP